MRYANTMLSSPDIGRELGVDALIEGSVNRSGNQVRITLQIIHAATDTHIGTLQFDRSTDDLLALQADVAQAVAAEIGGAYRAPSSTVVADVSPAAQDAYLRGKYEYDRNTPDGYRQALALFQQAVDSAPNYAEAWAGLAGARFLVALAAPEARREDLELARSEAEAALALDSTSLEVRDLYDVIRRSLLRMRRPDARIPGGDEEAIRVDVATFDTMWVASFSFAHLATSVARVFCPRPAGTAGWVTISSRLCSDPANAFKQSIPNCPLPR
jgi:tetratricopeptide (TPR) repeat protein